MRSQIRTRIDRSHTNRAHTSRANAAKSTGPTSESGKQRSRMNAFQHGLTGHRMILQDHELAAYRRLGSALHADYAPKTEIERQLVQKIVDAHTRLNRAFAIDSNILNATLVNESDDRTFHDDATECIVAQARAWTLESSTFEKISRYEGRLSRQVIQFTKELERIQAARRAHEAELAELGQPAQTKPVDPKVASFRQTTAWRQPLARTAAAALAAEPRVPARTEPASHEIRVTAAPE